MEAEARQVRRMVLTRQQGPLRAGALRNVPQNTAKLVRAACSRKEARHGTAQHSTPHHSAAQRTLYPLYSFGLCDAVTMTPPAAPSTATPAATKGVGTRSENRCTGTPWDSSTAAAMRANLREPWRPSKPAGSGSTRWQVAAGREGSV